MSGSAGMENGYGESISGDTTRLLSDLQILRELPLKHYYRRVWSAEDGNQVERRRQIVEALGASRTLVKVNLTSLVMTGEEVRLLCESLRSGNRVVDLAVRKIPAFGTPEACGEVADWLKHSDSSLKKLELRGTGMTDLGFSLITKALVSPHCVLESLNVSDNESLGDEGARLMKEALTRAPALKILNMSNTDIQGDGVRDIASALYHNACLEELHLCYNGLGCAGVKKLLEPLVAAKRRELGHSAHSGHSGHSGQSSGGASACNVRKLHIATWGSVKRCGDAVQKLLEDNNLLTELDLEGFDLSRKEWTDKVFAGLRRNTTLQTLSLKDCETVDGGVVYNSLMELLDENTTLRKIELRGTDLLIAGKAAAVQEKLRRNELEYVAVLKQLVHEKPTSARIFLCGFPYAGKTALRRSMVRAVHAQELKSAVHSGCVANFTVSCIESLTRLSDNILRRVDETESYTRTRGIEIDILKDDADMRVSVWDLAGQEDFHCVQDLMFPDVDSACIFLFVFSAVSHEDGVLREVRDLKTELVYWLRFIASTSRRPAAALPQVIVVITNTDRAPHESYFGPWSNTIKELGKSFEDFVAIVGIHFVNATSFRNVDPLATQVVEGLGAQLRTKTVPQACTQVRLLVQEWVRKHPNQPIIKCEEFFNICKEARSLRDIPGLTTEEVETRRRAVATYLHNAGEIIYFEDPEVDFVVVNPNWFCHGILGRLIKMRPPKGTPGGNNGFMTRADLQQLLTESIPSSSSTGWLGGGNSRPASLDDLIKLMVKMQLCYETPLGRGTGYFLPATLDDNDSRAAMAGERQLEWPDTVRGTCTYVGRRLECGQNNRTFFTPGFFPRLQVKLRSHWTGEDYALKRNLVAASEGGMDFLVEYSGSYSIDVLVRSCNSLEETLEAVQAVVSIIRTFCASHSGCVGVNLVEAVVRETCVRDLTLCRHRQAERVEDLKRKLQSASQVRYEYCWPVDAVAGLPSQSEPVCALLGNADARDALLDRPLRDLVSVAPPGQEPALRQLVRSHTSSGLSDSLDEIRADLARIMTMQAEIRDKMMAGLDDQLGFVLEQTQRAFPRLLYFTVSDVAWLRELINTLRPGRATATKLHFFCECRESPHVVERQPGIIVTLEDNLARDAARYFRATLRVLLALVKVGAHVAAGIGNAIPDFTKLAEASGGVGMQGAGLMVEEVMRDVNGSEGQSATGDFLAGLMQTVDIAQTFRLYKVRYRRQDHVQPHIAWLCKEHAEEGRRKGTLDWLFPSFVDSSHTSSGIVPVTG